MPEGQRQKAIFLAGPIGTRPQEIAISQRIECTLIGSHPTRQLFQLRNLKICLVIGVISDRIRNGAGIFPLSGIPGFPAIVSLQGKGGGYATNFDPPD